jgi:hypothetical protein
MGAAYGRLSFCAGRIRTMVTLLRREFIVELPLEKAWRHSARVEKWPSWAKHIKQITVQPPGALGDSSTGVIHLGNGIKSTFKMTQFNPFHNWTWIGGFLWLTIVYDHIFEQCTPQQTKLIWIVKGEGFGVAVFGRLFAKVYNGNLDKAIPALVNQMNSEASR